MRVDASSVTTVNHTEGCVISSARPLACPPAHSVDGRLYEHRGTPRLHEARQTVDVVCDRSTFTVRLTSNCQLLHDTACSKAIIDSGLCPPPGAELNPTLQLSDVQRIPPSGELLRNITSCSIARFCALAPWYENKTSSVKPEVRNVSQVRNAVRG